MALHKDLTGAQAVHQSAYVQDDDPGAVGALRDWYQTTTDPATHYVRNEANDDWLAVGSAEAGLTDHLADTTDAHDASAISYAGGPGMSATDVEAAVDELATGKANASGLTAHTGDTSDAHDASAISFVPAGTLAATDVQAAIEEAASEASGGGMTNPMTAEGDLIVGAEGVPTLTNETVGLSTSNFVASSYFSTFQPWQAFDANSATLWAVNPGDTNPWVKADLGSAKTIEFFRLQRTSAVTPTSVTIAYSTDDSSWTDVITASYGTDSGQVQIAPVSARYWRFSFVSFSAGEVHTASFSTATWSPVAGTPERLARGTTGKLLAVASGGGLEWVTAPTSGFANPMTTRGDIITGASSPAGGPQRLARGSTDQILSTNSSGDLAWVTPSGSTGQITKVERQANQPINHNTPTIVSLDAEIYDDGGWWAIGTPTKIFTGAGIFGCAANAAWTSNGTGIRAITLNRYNSSDTLLEQIQGPNFSAALDSLGRGAVNGYFKCSAGDYLSLEVYQNSGGSLNFGKNAVSGVNHPHITVVRLG